MASCETARLDLIGDWLDQTRTKKWTAKELKDEIAHAYSVKVREHQRSLVNGEDFDPASFKEAMGEVKHRMMAVKDQMRGLITNGKLVKSQAKALNSRIDELREALDQLQPQLQ
jgi:SMC interacting uncharacterized protein involved in chromosome segregation